MSTYSVCKSFLWPQNKLASLAPEASWLLPPLQAHLLYVKASRASVHTQQLLPFFSQRSLFSVLLTQLMPRAAMILPYLSSLMHACI